MNNVRYKIRVEVNTLKIEEILNKCIVDRIPLNNIIRHNRALITFETFYENYEDLRKIVRRYGGKIKIIEEKGNIIKIKKIKKRFSLFIGALLFLMLIFTLSSFVWAIDIETEKNLSSFEIREILNELGVKQGISKRKINVYEIEKEIENKSNEVLWVRTRIEGSTLKVVLKEKVNPPKEENILEENIYAKMDGEIKRIYSEKGIALVNNGDIVKKGDVLISGDVPLGEGEERISSKALGKVIANTFYTKEIDVKVSGIEWVRTGEIDKDIYIEILGKKIYFKKASKSFQKYDKIESNDGILNKTTYHEKTENEIKINREEIVKSSIESLEKLLTKDLSIDAKIIEVKNQILDLDEGKIKIIVEFTVEQNIANR
ncbi:sporulation protein YqfD [uncultured Clostridium sp.]|uniref:sporulation protein YqfD n=1 Tax=uncultured Clostridium sp. TaxID=59620 RepID=UPI0026216097|nr:sporulation protein YqfD [uncultured Clostridium sp.]